MTEMSVPPYQAELMRAARRILTEMPAGRNERLEGRLDAESGAVR